MKIKRKLDHCLNCYEELTLDDNYCPLCGQENQDQKVPVFVFLNDFLSNFLSFDSSLFKTLPAFLFKPGRLTQKFNEGKRRYYLHPIRLYLIFSLFYFFIVSIIVPPNGFDRLMTLGVAGLGISDDLVTTSNVESLSPEEKHKADSILRLSPITAKFVTLSTNAGMDSLPVIIQAVKWQDLKNLAQDEEVTQEEFELTLNKSNYNLSFAFGSKKELTRKFIANSNLYIANSARNLPLMMFVLLPFFALLLKILYIRSPQYYLEHLIHSLHLHAFAYLIYGFGILLIYYQWGNPANVIFVSFFLVTLYAFLSIKKIQKNGWFKTLFKFSLLGLMYFNILLIGLAFELYISLLLL